MSLQSGAIVAKKLLVDDKITTCVKVSNKNYYLVKHFAFLKNVCYRYFNFVLQVTYCFFYEQLIGPRNFLGMYKIIIALQSD